MNDNEITLARPNSAVPIEYAEKGYPYLLNVPAGRMSLNSGDPLG